MRLIFTSICSAAEVQRLERRAELGRRTVLERRGLQAPTIGDDPTLQSNALVSSKFTFMFLKSNLWCGQIVGLRSVECCLPIERLKCSHAGYPRARPRRGPCSSLLRTHRCGMTRGRVPPRFFRTYVPGAKTNLHESLSRSSRITRLARAQ